jgi:hypothetical protein
VARLRTDRERVLWRSYEDAVFRVFDGERQVRFHVGIASPDLDALLERYRATTWAHITAWNPRSNPLPQDENDDRQRRLVVALSEAGRIVLDGDGADPEGNWPPETTAFVMGIGVRDAVRLGREFGQLAIVVGRRGGRPRLVACDPAAGG